ncbi:MAG: ketopantoate reductase family protein, partial [Lachnospiraceae bacterium]
MQIKKAAIIGMGALGLLYGNHIADHIGPEAVDFLLGAERYDKYLKKTFEIQGEEKKLPIARAEQAEPYDLVILAVKYGAIESA